MVDGDTVYVGSFDDGTEQWRFTTGGPIISRPAVSGNAAFVGSQDGTLYAMPVDT